MRCCLCTGRLSGRTTAGRCARWTTTAADCSHSVHCRGRIRGCRLTVPDNIVLLPMLPYAPELNRDAWNKLMQMPRSHRLYHTPSVGQICKTGHRIRPLVLVHRRAEDPAAASRGASQMIPCQWLSPIFFAKIAAWSPRPSMHPLEPSGIKHDRITVIAMRTDLGTAPPGIKRSRLCRMRGRSAPCADGRLRPLGRHPDTDACSPGRSPAPCGGKSRAWQRHGQRSASP